MHLWVATGLPRLSRSQLNSALQIMVEANNRWELEQLVALLVVARTILSGKAEGLGKGWDT